MQGHSDINTTYSTWIKKKKQTRAYDHLKTSNVSADNLRKGTQPRWVDTWACDTVRWYWPSKTLFWQLSIDHNIDVQSVFSWAPKLGRKCKSKHWFPCGADGRSVGWSVYGQCSTGALIFSDFLCTISIVLGYINDIAIKSVLYFLFLTSQGRLGADNLQFLLGEYLVQLKQKR